MSSSVYVETSAALTWLLGEPKADKVRALLNKSDSVSSSTLTILETKRALHRLESQNMLNATNHNRALGMLENSLLGWTMFEMTTEIQKRAGDKFPLEPVRSLDAIHLATVLELIKVYPDIKVLTFDNRIIANLEPLGVEII